MTRGEIKVSLHTEVAMMDIKIIYKYIYMSLRKGEDTLICRKKLWIALCGELALEDALDLS